MALSSNFAIEFGDRRKMAIFRLAPAVLAHRTFQYGSLRSSSRAEISSIFQRSFRSDNVILFLSARLGLVPQSH